MNIQATSAPAVLPRNFVQDANRFTNKADQMAKEILAKKIGSTCDGPVVIRHYHYYNNPWWWYQPYFGPTYIISHDDCRGRRGHAKDDGAAVLLGITAGIAGAVALYAAGSAYSRLEDASAERYDTRSFKRDLDQVAYVSNQDEQRYVHQLHRAVDLKERICKRIERSAAWDLALRVGMAAACAIALTGVFTANPVLMMAGLVSGPVIGGAMLLKWGLEASDAKNFRDAQALRAVIADLN